MLLQTVFFLGCFVPFAPFLTRTTHEHCHFQVISSPKHAKQWIQLHFFTHTYLFHFFSLRAHPPLIQKGGGGAYFTSIFIFLWGHAQVWPKGGGGHVPEMPPPRSTYEYIPVLEAIASTNPRICATLPVFLYSMHLQDVTLSLHFVIEAKRQHGIHRKFPRHLKSFSLCKLRPGYGNTGIVCRVVLSNIMNVNNSRKYLFTQKSRSLENLRTTNSTRA